MRVSADEQQSQRWLDWLLTGSEADKLVARHGLTRVFEARGMLEEAIELLERNVEAGVRSAETLRWLSRLYQARDDVARSFETAGGAAPDQSTARMSELPDPVAAWTEPTLPWVLRHRKSSIAIVIGSGITVGAGLWMLTGF